MMMGNTILIEQKRDILRDALKERRLDKKIVIETLWLAWNVFSLTLSSVLILYRRVPLRIFLHLDPIPRSSS